MRIIAGEFRGRKILPPEGRTTRPITDRVKQSLFDILTPLLPEAVVYDCYAGTGSMGLESLSRGARLALFFEADRSAGNLLRRNVEALKVQQRARIIPGDLSRFFNPATRPQPAGDKADIIFLDPPYRYLVEQPEKLRQLAAWMAGDHLAPEGLVVLRHDADDRLELPALRLADQRTYGSMSIDFFRLPARPPVPSPAPGPPAAPPQE